MFIVWYFYLYAFVGFNYISNIQLRCAPLYGISIINNVRLECPKVEATKTLGSSWDLIWGTEDC